VEYWRRRGLAEYNFLAGDRTGARYKETLSTASRRLAWATFRRANLRMTALALLRTVKHGLASRGPRDGEPNSERRPRSGAPTRDGAGHVATVAGPDSTSELEIQSIYRGRSVAKRYVRERFTDELNRLLHNRQVAVLQALIERARPTRILEIAAGPGRLTRDLRPIGPLMCAEYNEGMLEEGRRICGDHVRWIRSDGFRLPVREAFDLVYVFRFIRHFRRRDRFRLYAEVRRVLKPGGFFAIDAVNERVSRPLRERHPEQYPIYDELYTAERLRTELHEAGFDVTLLEPVQKYYRWQYRSQVFLGRAAWLNRCIIRTLERLPRRHGLEWVVVCRRG
jgi:ubiquinone/menaquinone biosynthesis C-methylase UbiE